MHGYRINYEITVDSVGFSCRELDGLSQSVLYLEADNIKIVPCLKITRKDSGENMVWRVIARTKAPMDGRITIACNNTKVKPVRNRLVPMMGGNLVLRKGEFHDSSPFKFNCLPHH